MNSERRSHERRVLYSPEYLDMGADNGGVVVNLSEGGLAFQAVGPVAPQSEIPLSFSLGQGYRIDVKARVVWVNAEGKLGGAAFGKLSKDSKSLIREWVAKPDVEHESENAIVDPVAVREAEGLSESALPANPHPSAVATQTADVPPAEGMAAGNGSLLTSYDITLPVEPPPTESFAPHGIASPPLMPASETISPKFPASALSRQKRGAPVAATPPIHEQAPTSPPTAEPGRQRPGGASYSVAPSISAWNRNDSYPATRDAGHAFPPRNTENIFARSSSRVDYEHRGRRSGALAIFAIVIAAGAVVAFYARTHRQQIGSEITQIGNTIAGTPSAASTTAAPQTNTATANQASSSPNGSASTSPAKPAQTPPAATSQEPAASAPPDQSASQGAASAPKTPDSTATPTTQAARPNDGNVPSGNTKAPPPTKSSAALNSSKSAADNTSATNPVLGQAEYQRAESYLNGKGVYQDSAQAAEWFWRSLEAGNTSAAIPLADLYLAGNGVSRSCTQARILLDAAAEKNNATAIKKLAELPESCH